MKKPLELMYLLNSKNVDCVYYNNLNVAVNDALYWMKTIPYKVDQVKIYKNNMLISELNK